MANAGFVMSRQPTTEEKERINHDLTIDNPERFWDGGDCLIVYWNNNYKPGDLNGLIKSVFDDRDTINYL